MIEPHVDPVQLPHPMQDRCGRKTRGDYPCRNWPLPGQTVCRMHGGSSPQALAKAEDRMRALIHPALDSLARMISKDEFQATKYVLDFAGFRAVEQSSTTSDSAISVTVHFDHADQTLSIADGS